MNIGGYPIKDVQIYNSNTMKPIFTIHAGEYLVGSYIEEHYKYFNVWIPSKDTGIGNNKI
jgi:hypothetical protein